ncbi:MAG: tRNA pseudouridine(55) synthase TruB [Selenomonadales bacterium]|nr:tRNA pseudouridine(55) synthase TruB [Selenomonadales bacterium]MDD6218835.1 tRNA pseudouridine(55) synthase TruB [Selenomonadaceae bacterium]
MEGFLNILKPPGMTSHDVVGFVRHLFHEKQVGHAGTLDPGAAGVLPVAVGKAARLIEYLSDAGKSYRAELVLGASTDSGDDTGSLAEEKRDFSMPSKDEFLKTLDGFTGEITQVPPAHSAIKINGQKCCDLVRRGIQIDIPSRQVAIYALKLLVLSDGRDRGERAKALIDVDCSKGTYIRTLCADIGSSLGIPSTMGFLLRTRAGDFRLEDSVTIEELAELGEKALLPADSCISHIPAYHIIPQRVKAFCNGLSTNDYNFEDDGRESLLLRVYGEGRFLGIGHYDRKSQSIMPDKVIHHI